MKTWKVLCAVAFALFMDYFLYGLMVPLAPHAPVGKMTEDRLAMMFSGYAIGVLLATPLFGYLGDRIGLRRPMLAGVLLSATATFLVFIAPNFPLAVLARVLQGAASAATWTAGLALVAANYPTRRVEMMGYTLVGSTAGSILGPVLGGSLFEYGGFELPFMVAGALVILDGVLRFTLLPLDRADAAASAPLRSLLTDRTILMPALGVVLAAFGWGIAEPLLPGRLELAGSSTASIGLVFTAATIAYGVFAPVVSWTTNRVPIRQVIAGGVVAMALLLPALSLVNGAFATGVVLCFVSVAFAFTLNPTSAELANAVDRRGLSCYAAVYAVYNIAYSIGMKATNSLVLVTADRLSHFHTLIFASALLLVCVPFLLRPDAPGTVPATSNNKTV